MSKDLEPQFLQIDETLSAHIWNLNSDLLLVRLEGQMSIEALLGQASSQQNRNTEAQQIFDIRAVEFGELKTRQLMSAAENWKVTSHETILLVSSDLEFGLSRMFGAYSDERKVVAFRTIDQVEQHVAQDLGWYRELHPD